MSLSTHRPQNRVKVNLDKKIFIKLTIKLLLISRIEISCCTDLLPPPLILPGPPAALLEEAWHCQMSEASWYLLSLSPQPLALTLPSAEGKSQYTLTIYFAEILSETWNKTFSFKLHRHTYAIQNKVTIRMINSKWKMIQKSQKLLISVVVMGLWCWLSLGAGGRDSGSERRLRPELDSGHSNGRPVWPRDRERIQDGPGSEPSQYRLFVQGPS